MVRYSILDEKNPREIVLLKSFPCRHGKCSFCDYIEDNEKDSDFIVNFNKKVLANITGIHRQLEVINSGSVFELPKKTLELIKKICINKKIHTLYFECHYSYKNRLDEIRNLFDGITIIFKCGIETFDDHFRNVVLKKGTYFNGPNEVSKYFKSICLLIGIQGQTKNMIDNDIEIALNFFDRICINIFENNTTKIRADKDLQRWFIEKYSCLKDNPKVELLIHITDFGVGSESQGEIYEK